MQKIISGKVREVYEIDGEKLIIVTTDRISAFDVILNKTVPNKGKVLNSVALYWFNQTKNIVGNHIISDKLEDMPKEFSNKSEFEGRTILVKKLKMLPFEFIVRGYIFGNMWKAYENGELFCGQKIDGDFKLAEKLTTPILTPSTKASDGEHDIYITIEEVAKEIGNELAQKLQEISLKIYNQCWKIAYEKGIIIADTKFEFGLDENNNIILADEILTPDSSRFWSLEDYKTGVSPKSYDKQFIRDWLSENKLNGDMQFDAVPDDIIAKTAEIYQECLRKITW